MNTVTPFENRSTFAPSLPTRAGRWLLLCAVLLLSVPTLRAQLTYTVENGAITITGYKGTIFQLIIPATIHGLPVKFIGNSAFSYRFDLTSLSIPNSVTSVGHLAFYKCASLTSLSIPNRVTSVGESAFSGCNGLTSVSIPSSVTSIGDYAFSRCTGLTSLSIPDSVTSIGEGEFQFCTGLAGVYFKGNKPGAGSLGTFFKTPARVYYLPGTTGWAGGFAGRPTALWNPSASTQDPAFGVRDGKFTFKITGTADIPVVVEACDSLTEPVWVPVRTNTLAGGSSLFSDPSWASHQSRVYRFRSP
jgi:hypothetical protein